MITFLSAAAALFALQCWLSHTSGQLFSYRTEIAYLQTIIARGPLGILMQLLANLLRASLYLGLLSLPFAVGVLPGLLTVLSSSQRKFYLALAAELAVLYVCRNVPFAPVHAAGRQCLF